MAQRQEIPPEPPEDRHPSQDESDNPWFSFNPAEEREILRQQIEGRLRVPLAILAVMWAILLAIDLVGELPPSVRTWTLLVEGIIWAIFALDFIVELLISTDRGRFLRTHPVALISLAIPFARILTVARLVYLLRPTILIRILIIVDRASRSARELLAEYRFGYVAVLVVIVEFVGAAAILFFESGVPGTAFTTYGTALWWTANLLTTVNAGPEPVTTEGRLLALLLRVFAIFLVAYLTSSLTSYFVTRKAPRRPILRSVESLDQAIEQFRDQLATFEYDIRHEERQQTSHEEEE